MKRILLCCIVILAALLAGCTQPATTTTAPPAFVQTQSVAITPTTAISPVPTFHMQINVTAVQTNSDVIVQYNGGQDAAYLTGLKIRIDNYNGQTIERTMTYPKIGDVYTFSYIGTPDADRVNVIGTFTGGSEQTVLFTYV
ncbi:MAG: hypothetical protein WC391_08030 [Methanoregula sp.]